jgi:hypothetical protein
MFLKRWLDTGRNTNATVNTSLSLSSPRGTTTARKKNTHRRLFDAFVRYAQHNGDLASLVGAMTLVLGMIVVFVVVAATGIYTVSPAGFASSRGLAAAAQQRPVTSPLSFISRLTRSVRNIRTRRPRGHRYFDYWQDEEHKDYEPYPWKFMKRPSSSSNKEASISGSPSIIDKHHGRPPMDDETYVPTPTLSNGKRKHGEEEEVPFNDRSPFYAQLRKSYESYFPPPKTKDSIKKAHDHDPNAERCLQAVQDLETYTGLQTYLPASDPDPNSHVNSDFIFISNKLYYDIHNCPETPPKGYPVEWNLVHEVLSQWPADDPELPASGTLHQGLCVFDLQADDYEGNLAKALNYRNAEVPFVVRGDPRVAQTVERWNAPHYLSTLVGDAPQGTETSSSGTFTYWTGSGVDTHKYPMDGYKTPTEVTEMTFGEWIELANVTDSQLLTPESPHYYFRVVGCAPGTAPGQQGHKKTTVDNSCSMLAGKTKHVPYLADELPFYAQTKTSLYIKEPLSEMRSGASSSKALNCRFGMKGVMATNHFDGERNFVTVLSGERRYVLAHPEQCGNMALFPYGHPSARHSAVDWAHPDLDQFPEFEKARGNEVVLQAGDSLFLPSLWFHYIVSMSMNVQCNTRSGMDQRNVQVLDDSCGW